MAKGYKELRKAMIDKDMVQLDICNILGKSDGYFTERIMGRQPFSMRDVYKICKVLEIPVTEIHTYFPPEKEW